MSRFGSKKGKRPPGAEFTWDTEPGGQPDTAPTPLFPKYAVPVARMLSTREKRQINLYRELRERFHEGPYYSVLDAAGTTAKKGSAARAHFDPFHGMPSYSEKYQKKKRTLPKLQGRPYVLKFFPRELWQTIQPSYKPEGGLDAAQQRVGIKRGFEDEEEDDEEITKRRKADEDEDETEERRQAHDEDEEGNIPDEDEEQEEEIVDDDFSEDDDEMGGDYNAEQYFDAGEDEGDGDGFADGGGGGDEDTY